MEGETYRATFSDRRQVAQSDIDAAEFRIHLHQDVERETSILSFASKIWFRNTLRSNASDGIAVTFDGSIDLRAFRRYNHEEKFDRSATIESRDDVVL